MYDGGKAGYYGLRLLYPPALSQLGCRVALVDADFGLRNLDLLLGLEQRIVYTALDVVAGDCSLDKALVKDKRQENLVLLPAAQNVGY